jgi:hypothetical protein
MDLNFFIVQTVFLFTQTDNIKEERDGGKICASSTMMISSYLQKKTASDFFSLLSHHLVSYE